MPRQLEQTTGWRWHGGDAAVTGPLVPVCLDVLQFLRGSEWWDLPVVTGLDFGHTDPMWTVPVGGVVEVDPQAEQVRFPKPVTTN